MRKARRTCSRRWRHPVPPSPTCEITKPAEGFPYTPEELASRFDVVVLSDIPADSLLLPHAVFVKGEKRPNRLRSLGEFVERGGGLLMVGGYMSFAGFEGRARYASTPLAEALPVEISHYDDRIEEPEGVNPKVMNEHAILDGISGDWPYFLGYNRFKARPGSEVILSVGEDPFLVVDRHGSGRIAAFASDCSPHWVVPNSCMASLSDVLVATDGMAGRLVTSCVMAAGACGPSRRETAS